PAEPGAQPSLGELSASDVTHDSVLLSWTVPAGDFDSFLLQYKDAEGQPQALPVDGGSRTVTVPNLAPSRRYKFNLYGVSGRKRLGPLSTDATTAAEPQEAKPAPEPSLGDLSASDVTHESVLLSWTVPAGDFDSFLLQYKDAEGQPQALPVDGGSRTVTVPNLAPSRRYKFNLYGVSGRKRLGPLSTDATTVTRRKSTAGGTRPTPQPSLGELSASDVTHDSVLLSWTVPAGDFDSFLLQYKDAEGRPQALPMDGGSRTVTVPNLAPSRRYKFNLYGVSGRKRLGPVSTDATTGQRLLPGRRPLPLPPPLRCSVQDLPNPPLAGNSLALEGPSEPTRAPQGPSSDQRNCDSFLLQYKDAEGQPQALPVDGGSRTVTVPNLAPSRRYKFNLYGVSGRKRLGPLSTDATTAAAPQEEPSPQPSLGELSASDITHDSVLLSWTIDKGTFDSFLLQYKDAEGQPQALPVDGGSRTVTVPNLAPSRRYKFNLYGVSGRKRLGPLSTDATTAPRLHLSPSSPREPSLGELSASDITHDSVLLSWTVPAGDFDSFLLQYKDAEGQPQALPVDGGSRTVTVPNLAPSRRYKFNLYGVSGRKRLGPLSTDATTAAAPQTEQPAPQPSLGELSASDITHDSVLLSWTVPAGDFDSFLLQYKDAEGQPQALRVDGASRTVTIPNLAPSHRYKFRWMGGVDRWSCGMCKDGWRRWNQLWGDGGHSSPAPREPSLGELSASDVTHDSVLLSWTVPAGDFDSFLLQYKDAEGKPQALPVDGGSRTVTVPNLAPSRRYKFNLYGVSGRKRLGPLSTDATTAAEPQEEPTPHPSLGELSASDVTHDSVLLSWTVPAGDFDSFLLQYKDAEGQPQALRVDGASRTVTVPNLAPSRRYKFNLYGVSGRKRLGPLSTDATTATAPQEEVRTQLRLGKLSAANAAHDSLDLSWTVEEGTFDSFIVQYRDADGNPRALPVDGALRSLHLHDLAPSHRYKINLYGVSGRKRLGPVSTNATTAAEPQGAKPTLEPSLGELSASDVTHDSVLLSWTVPAGDFDSFLLQYKDAEGQPQALRVDGASRTVTVPNLAPSPLYKINLYGVSGRKRLGPVSTNATTAPRTEEPLLQMTRVMLPSSDITHDSVRLSWTIDKGTFDSFLLQYKDAEGQPQALPVDGGSRSVTVPNLAPSRRYKFNLYGVSGRKRLGPVSTDATTGQRLPPGHRPSAQPSLGDLSASDVTHESVRLSWTVPAGDFDSFLLQYKDAEGKPQALPVDGGSRTVTVPNLAPSRRYKFNLYGVSGRKRLGPLSTDATTVPRTLTPRGPSLPKEQPALQPSLGELSVSDITHDSVLLSWTIDKGTFDSFLLQYKDAEGQPQALPVDGGSRTVTVPNLAPSRRYKFNLYGVSGRKRLGPLSTDATTEKPQSKITCIPGPPKSNTPGPSERESSPAARRDEEPTAQPSLGELSPSWPVPAGDFDSFLLQYKDAEGQPQALPVDGGSRTVTVPNLAPSRRYKFNLYGVSGRKRLGPLSTDATTVAARFTPISFPATAPQEEVRTQLRLGKLSAANAAHDSLDLSWTVEEGTFDSFIVQYRDADGNPRALPVDGALRSLHLHDLAPSHRYKINLYGVSGRKRLGPVSTNATTDSNRHPSPPLSVPASAPQEEEPTSQPSLGELSASNITHDSVLLSWTVSTGDFDSFLLQYKDAEGNPQELPVEGGFRTVTVPNLAPSRRYKFNLYGVSGRKRLGPVSTDATTGLCPLLWPTPPQSPQPSLGELTASSITHDSVLLSWTVPAGDFDSFLLQYKDAEGQPQALRMDGGSRTVTIPNLTPSPAASASAPSPPTPPQIGEICMVRIDRQKVTKGPLAAEPQEAKPAPEPSLGDLSASPSWPVPAGDFDSFLLQYKDAEGQPQALPVDGGSRTVTVPNLAPSRRYKFNLYGVSGRKRLGPLSTDATTGIIWLPRDPANPPLAMPFTLTPSVPAAKPQEPKPEPQPSLGELSASDVTHDSVLLSWTVDKGTFDSFLLQYKDAEGKPQALPVDGGSRTVTVPNLAPSRRYKFNLYGVSGRKRLGPLSTDATTGQQGPAPLSVPTTAPREEPAPQPSLGELSASDITHESVLLSWTIDKGTFDSFLLQYKDAEGQPQALPVDGGSRMVTVPNLAPSRRYKFNLYGVSGRKRLGPLSTDTGSFRSCPLSCAPSLGELSASDVTHNSVLLAWTVPAGDFDSFILQYKDAEGQPQALSMDGGTRTVTVPNLAPSHRYKFNLYGVSGRKRLGPVSAPELLCPPPQEEPSLGELSASDITHESVLLSWTVPAGDFDSFLLQYKDAEGQPQALPVDGGSRTVTVPNLAPSRRYKFNLYGVSGRKRLGPLSTDATTAAARRDEEPTAQPSLGELSASNVTHESVLLSWTVPAGDFDSFLLQYKDAEGQPQALPVDGGSRTVTVPNLAPSRRYKFNLYGVSGRKRLGPLSTDATTGIQQAPPLAMPGVGGGPPTAQPSLGDLSASDVTHESVRLSWTVPAGDFDSFLLQYKDAEGKPQALPVDGGSRTVTVPNLAPSRRYKFNLYGVSGRKRLGPLSTDATTG
uniref:Fibronectin type-III domain-containing protein n=1 Tax=Pelodiscus sinensis TaxID=13735 RepID=K7FLA8_PELSI